MAAQLYNDLPQPLPQPTVAATPTPFPARTRQAARILDGLRTDITVTKFSDKIMVTIAQEGYGLGHFVCLYIHPNSHLREFLLTIVVVIRYTSLSNPPILP